MRSISTAGTGSSPTPSAKNPTRRAAVRPSGSTRPSASPSAQADAYVSYTDGRTFSVYAGYGVERGPQADASIITLGWGGVRPIPAASKQLGFHGKFLRYRRWDEEGHGIHHGLSFGTEQGVGFGALSFELGAARSERNHWLITMQVVLKFAVPVHIPLTKKTTQSPKGSS